jgi:hypothetical protein
MAAALEESIRLGDIAVDVVRKDIRNVHLSVYPPTGRSADFRAAADEIGYGPLVCDFQVGVDKATADENCWPGAGIATRVSGSGEPLRLW